jgi:integrase
MTAPYLCRAVQEPPTKAVLCCAEGDGISLDLVCRPRSRDPPKGRWSMATIFRTAEGNYRVMYVDEDGRRASAKGRFASHALAEEAAHAIEAEMGRRRNGVITDKEARYALERAKPLSAHVDDYVATLAARGSKPKQQAAVRLRLLKTFALGGVKTLAALTLGAVQKGVGKLLADEEYSAQTVKHYCQVCRSFSSWLWRDRRIDFPTLADLKAPRVCTPTRVRRALTVADLTALILAAQTSADDGRFALDGKSGAVAYALAASTGLRRGEIASLTAASFDFALSTVKVEGAYSKNGKTATLPLAPSFAPILAEYVKGKPKTKPLFALPKFAAKMIRADLKRAGVPFKTEDGVADFHALRHTYVTLLISTGASVKTVQDLARHSTPTLTFAVYGHSRDGDRRAAIEALPKILAAEEGQGGERVQEVQGN